MDGNKIKKAMGYKPFKLGNKEYNTKLYLDDITNYIKFVKNNGIRITLAGSDKNIEDLEKYSDDILDYKIEFVKQSLINYGMTDEKAEELTKMNIRDIIKEGNIELWLELTTQKEIDKKVEVKN